MTDVVIAGGGVAGSALAILLGRRGLTVELFEAGRFPREKPCGEGLMPAGVGVLERLGLAQAVGGAPFHGVRYHLGSTTAEGRFPKIGGLPADGRGQRRRHLDRVLFEAASATPGVRAHTGTRVEGPVQEAGRVTGLQVEGERLLAKLTVAADGLRSELRRELGLERPVARQRFGVRAHFRLAPDREQPPWVEVFVASGYELYVTPLPEREVLVAALVDGTIADVPIEQAFRRWRESHAALAERLSGAEQLTPLLGASPLAVRVRSGVAPGVVLLGDAAGFIDPITGGGMAQALLTAELLASHLEPGLERVDDRLPMFEQERRRLLRDYRLLTGALLWLANYPHAARGVLSVLGKSSALMSHLVGVAGGVRPLVPNLLRPSPARIDDSAMRVSKRRR